MCVDILVCISLRTLSPYLYLIVAGEQATHIYIHIYSYIYVCVPIYIAIYIYEKATHVYSYI
jgi:hypothetical protein